MMHVWEAAHLKGSCGWTWSNSHLTVSPTCSHISAFTSLKWTHEAISHHLIRLKWLLYYWNLTKLRVLEGQYSIHCLCSSLNSHATDIISSLWGKLCLFRDRRVPRAQEWNVFNTEIKEIEYTKTSPVADCKIWNIYSIEGSTCLTHIYDSSQQIWEYHFGLALRGSMALYSHSSQRDSGYTSTRTGSQGLNSALRTNQVCLNKEGITNSREKKKNLIYNIKQLKSPQLFLSKSRPPRHLTQTRPG